MKGIKQEWAYVWFSASSTAADASKPVSVSAAATAVELLPAVEKQYYFDSDRK